MFNETGQIDYSKLVDNAMREIAKQILKIIELQGLRGEHYFLITFLTSNKDVEIPEKIRARYSPEMTIILQHQFEQLEVSDEYFRVKLSFDGIKESLKIPFSALSSIVDPSTKFALQFNVQQDYETTTNKKPKNKKHTLSKNEDGINKSAEKKEDKIIVLDHFRKKDSNGK